MKFGPLFIGWVRIEESDRIKFGLEPWPLGWEVLNVHWNGRGFTTFARPREMKA